MTTTHDDKAREREQFEQWAGMFPRLTERDRAAAWEAWLARAALCTGQDLNVEALKAKFKQIANARVAKWEQLGNCGMAERAKADYVTGFGILCDALTSLAAPAQQVEAEKWISVETTMPNTQQRVLIAYTTSHGKRAVTLGWYCKAKTVESAYCEGEVDDEYDEETDTYFMKEQWVDESHESEYHYPIRNVTHWMPMPQGPAAGSNNGEKG